MPRRWGTLPAALQRVAEEHPHQASAPRLVIVVPTLNEADNLPRLVERFFTLAPAEAVLLVVDDTSPDGTADSRLLVLAAPIAAQVFSLHQHASFTSGFPFGLLLGNLLLTVALVTITWNHGRHGGFAVLRGWVRR